MALGRAGQLKERNLKRKEKDVISSLHMFVEKTFYNQTSLKGFSTFSTISLAFSEASVIHALRLLPFPSHLYKCCADRQSTSHEASKLITESLRETLMSAAAFPVLNCFDTSILQLL